MILLASSSVGLHANGFDPLPVGFSLSSVTSTVSVGRQGVFLGANFQRRTHTKKHKGDL